MDFLSGKKTYIVVVGVVLVAVGGFLAGDLTLQEAINQTLMGFGLGALRMGVAKKQEK